MRTDSCFSVTHKGRITIQKLHLKAVDTAFALRVENLHASGWAIRFHRRLYYPTLRVWTGEQRSWRAFHSSSAQLFYWPQHLSCLHSKTRQPDATKYSMNMREWEADYEGITSSDFCSLHAWHRSSLRSREHMISQLSTSGFSLHTMSFKQALALQDQFTYPFRPGVSASPWVSWLDC